MLKWNETWDYKCGRSFWWTQRDENGVCFAVRRNDFGDKFYLFRCDDYVGTFGSLQGAMDAAEAQLKGSVCA